MSSIHFYNFADRRNNYNKRFIRVEYQKMISVKNKQISV